MSATLQSSIFQVFHFRRSGINDGVDQPTHTHTKLTYILHHPQTKQPQEYFHSVAAPSSPCSSSTTKDEGGGGGGHLGFYGREEQRALARGVGEGAEDDLEEEDVRVPTLHVGARSPFTVRRACLPACLLAGCLPTVPSLLPFSCAWSRHALVHSIPPNTHTHTHNHPPGDGGVPGGRARLLPPPPHRPAPLLLPRQRRQEERRRRRGRGHVRTCLPACLGLSWWSIGCVSINL